MPVPFGRDSIRGSIPQNFIPSLDDEKEVILDYSPGSKSFVELPYASQIRGMHNLGNFIYMVGVVGNTSRVWKTDLSGGYIELGSIASGLGPVWIDDNGVQVGFCDGTTGQKLYVYNVSTGVFGEVTDGDFPGASSFVVQDGYGVFTEPDSGRFWLTALYDLTDIDPLDFATAEGVSDDLVGLISDHREILLAGTKTTEIWQNAGTSPFPFARIPGGLIEEGCWAAKSMLKADNTSAWLTPKMQFIQLDGYTPKIISTRKVEREVAGYAVSTDAIGFSFTWRGHLMLAWAFPTANTTLVYDVATKVWWRWASSNEENRHRANCHTFITGRHFIGDYQNGTVWELDGDTYFDGTEIIRRKLIISGITTKKDFLACHYLQTFWDQGVGLEDGSTPQVMMRISDDGGKTWGSEWWEVAGKVGETKIRTQHTGLGGISREHERVYEIVVTSEIPWRLLDVRHAATEE